MQIVAVDPRDTTWEDESPTYRVYFWESDSPQATIDTSSRPGEPDRSTRPESWSSEEYEIREAIDAVEVWNWAQQESGGRIIQIFLLATEDDSKGMYRLFGPIDDPTFPTET